jgi:DNA ligase 1
MLLARLAASSQAIGETRSRKRKTAAIAELLRELMDRSPDELPIAVAYLSGSLPQGKIGLGYAAMKIDAAPAAEPSLTLREVDTTLAAIAGARGKGATRERHRLFGELLARATASEQALLESLVVGELRQGALEGIVLEGVATAASVDAGAVRRAAMLAGDLGAVAAAAFDGGAPALSRFGLEVGRPLQPMLAQTSGDAEDALGRLGVASFEYKLDGARIQVHKRGDDIAVFSRNLREVTSAVPEVVELVRALPAHTLVLDGEVLALQDSGAPHPFQITMRRFGRKRDVSALRSELPLSPFFFDLIHLDGETLIDRPTRERLAAMAVVPSEALVPRVFTGDAEAAEAFFDRALDAGHEGVMAKRLDAPYAAGSRGADWLKIKPAHTLDLVVLAAEWGSGRRQGWLSNLHLGARNPDGSFTMLGKTFKGMTDAMLRWQTEKLLALEIARDAHTVYVKPSLVAEIAVNDIQTSPHYPGGLALRFARVKRYRDDKRPEDADTLETVRAIHTGLTRKPR